MCSNVVILSDQKLNASSHGLEAGLTDYQIIGRTLQYLFVNIFRYQLNLKIGDTHGDNPYLIQPKMRRLVATGVAQ